MEWLPLTLLCAWSIATSDALVKHWFQGVSAREMTLVRFTLSGLLLTPLIVDLPLDNAPPQFWFWIAGLVPLEVIAMMLYMRAVRDYPLGMTLPYLSFTPVFAIITGWLFLGELVSLSGLGGIVFITAGAWLLNLDAVDRLHLKTLLVPLQAVFRNPGSRMMLVTAFIYSITLAGGKVAMQLLPPTPLFGAFYFSLVGLGTLLAVMISRPSAITILWKKPGPALVVAALMAVMVVTHFMALQQIEAAYMSSVKRLSLLIGIVYGAWWFREEGLSRKLPAGVLMVAGVALIVTS